MADTTSKTFAENVNHVAELDNSLGYELVLRRSNIVLNENVTHSALTEIRLFNRATNITEILSVPSASVTAAGLNAYLGQVKTALELAYPSCVMTHSVTQTVSALGTFNNAQLAVVLSGNDYYLRSINIKISEVDGIQYDIDGNIVDPIEIMPHMLSFDENIFAAFSSLGTITSHIDDIESIADAIVPNIAEILLADTNAAIATAKASDASSSAASAAASALSASTSASNAAMSEDNAGLSEIAAAASAIAAAGSANIASTSAATATTKAGIATNAATEASASASSAASALASIQAIFDNFDDIYLGAKAEDPTLDNDGDPLVAGQIYWNITEEEVRFYNGAVWERPEYSASQSAINAASSASSAATSAANAAASATSAGNSATTAVASATTATTKASEATASAVSASTSASNAASSATNAENSASAANTSATAAANSATLAGTSASAAANSATEAAILLDQFDDRYLGSKASDPLTDNDYNTLLVGALYYNTTTNTLKIWTGSVWNPAAFDATGAVTSFNTRTGAVTLLSSDVTTALGYTPEPADVTIVKEATTDTLTNKTIDSITNKVGADHIHYPVRNVSGSTIAAGTVVTAQGTQSGTDYVEVVPVTNPQTQVALGILYSTIANNGTGLCMNTGVSADAVDTSGWAVGTILYPNNTGGLTSTKPTSGHYQACAVVLRSHANQGTLLVEFTEPKYIASTTQAGYVQLNDTLTSTSTVLALTAAQGKVLQDGKAPVSHAHGDITNAGAITSTAVAPADTDYLLISDTSNSGKIQRGVAIGSGITTFLRNDGTWGTPIGTTYSLATASVLGLVKLGSDTVQSTASNAVTTTASRSYAIQANASGQMVVNVPWTDTVYTHPTTDGNLHVPATGTTSNGKVLTAGATAGSFSWQTPTVGATTLDSLTDVTITTPSSGQVIKYNGSAWVNDTDATGGGSGATLTVSNKTDAYTVVAGDLGTIINCTSGTFTVSLTAAATLGAGFNCIIRNGGTGTITIDPDGAELIDNAALYRLAAYNGGVRIVSNGTSWDIYEAAVAGYSNRIILGSSATAGTGGIALGGYATSTSYAISAGNGASASGASSTAIGLNSGITASQSAGSGSTALGGSYASGTDSFACAIANNTSSYGATGANSLAIGYLSKASSSPSFAFGYRALASNNGAVALGGLNTGNTASGYLSCIVGGDGAVASTYGKEAFACREFATAGDAQRATYIIRRATTNETPSTLGALGDAAGANNQVILPNNSAYTFTGIVISKQSGSTNVASWKIEGVIVRGANAASTTLVASTVTAISNLPAWALALSADTTNGGLSVTFTGAAATNIRTVATIETTEVIYA